MALNPERIRAEGVAQLTAADLSGSVGADGRGVNLPEATYSNPGATPNLRGVEANTALTGSSIIGEPMIQDDVVQGYTRPAPWSAPDNSNVAAVGPGDPVWAGRDSAFHNQSVTNVPQDSFGDFGESYPGNGGLDGAD